MRHFSEKLWGEACVGGHLMSHTFSKTKVCMHVSYCRLYGSNFSQYDVLVPKRTNFSEKMQNGHNAVQGHSRSPILCQSKARIIATVFSIVGNILVLVVIAVHKRMRTITNFFLANLAVADLCVGVFCVLPNLSTYLSPHWLLGRVR